MVLLHDIPNLLWLSNDAVATFVVGQISCNWGNPTWVKVTLLFLLCRADQSSVIQLIGQYKDLNQLI